MKWRLLGIVVGLSLVSCSSYQWHRPILNRTLHVPFVRNDVDGQFTSVLLETLAQSGFSLDSRAHVQLEVELVRMRTSPVGYTYGYDDRGQPTTALYANEARHEWVCQVAVKDVQTQQYLINPQRLNVSTDIDYQIDDMPYNEVQFSVGQLNTREEALASSQVPLGRKLARLISDWLIARWPAPGDNI